MPVLFTNEEYCDIHFVYGFCDGNSAAAVREYQFRFPGRRVPNAQVFIDTHNRFRQFGLQKHNEIVRNENPRQRRNNNRILRLFDHSPYLSTRRASQQVQLPRSNIFRILKRDHRKAFHLQPVQGLLPGDLQKRVNFCRWILDSVAINPNVLTNILWTDEAQFTKAGVVNFHNLHVWAHENPHEVRPTSFQNKFSVNVWMGVVNDNVCGPHILPPRLNATLFHEFLENNLPELQEEVPLNIRQEGWIQMDGAPAHYGHIIREWLTRNYPQRWIGRINDNVDRLPLPGVGPVAWPPRSPDLNPLDFFFRGYLKESVYAVPVQTRDELILRLENGCNILKQNPLLLRTSINSLIRRCQKCIDAGGSHFEQLL